MVRSIYCPGRRPNTCPFCGKDPGPGDVSPMSTVQWETSEAQQHLAKCIAQNATGRMRDAIAQLISGSAELEELFGPMKSAMEERQFDIDDLTVLYDDVIEAFFTGMDGSRIQERCIGLGKEHVWVSRHTLSDGETVVETLIIEPNGSAGPGQHEVAVRFPRLVEQHGHGANDMPGYVAATRGLNPRGGIDH